MTRVAVLLVVASLLTLWALLPPSANAGGGGGSCANTMSIVNFENTYLECFETFCRGCWRYGRSVRLDFCVGSSGTECKCRSTMLTTRLKRYLCSPACGCTFIEDSYGPPIHVEVEERICWTSRC